MYLQTTFSAETYLTERLISERWRTSKFEKSPFDLVDTRELPISGMDEQRSQFLKTLIRNIASRSRCLD
jgi:hypothetical protein